MDESQLEIESKFYVRNLATIEARLRAQGATRKLPRGFEYNLRFDDAQNSLMRERKVLRLRKFNDIRLTFKGPGRQVGGALVRTEIELVVNDFESAKQFLEGLGYRIVIIYEKYRSTYELDGMLVTLDEMPYGTFVEIEGGNPNSIAVLAHKLGLRTEAAIPVSYQGLFEHIKQSRQLDIPHLTFEAFSGVQVSPGDMGAEPADEA